MEQRIKDFFLYTILEQERKMLEKVKDSIKIIANPVPLWYAFSSQFASTTMSMRLPIWFVCCIWPVWNPRLDTKGMVGIEKTPDPQGASLAIMSALDLPAGITPAHHVLCMAKWFLKLIMQWNKDRDTFLAPYSLETTWEELEPLLARFYMDKIDAEMRPGFAEKMWSLCPSVPDEMPGTMSESLLMVQLLGAPASKK
jgi:hypothetical protein